MNITRRFFPQILRRLAATYCGINPSRLLAEVGLDADNLLTVSKNKTLVAVFLRGGMDGLNFVAPYKDPGYYKLRKNIALAEPGKPGGLIDLNGFFGLHPRAAALAPIVRERPGRGAPGGRVRSQHPLAFRGTGHLGNRRQRQHDLLRRLAQPPPADQPGPRADPRRERRRHAAPHPARQGPRVRRARHHGSEPFSGGPERVRRQQPEPHRRRARTRVLLRPAHRRRGAGRPRRAAHAGQRRAFRPRPPFANRAHHLRRHRADQGASRPGPTPRRRSTRRATSGASSNRSPGSSNRASAWRWSNWITAAGTRTRTRAAPRARAAATATSWADWRMVWRRSRPTWKTTSTTCSW